MMSQPRLPSWRSPGINRSPVVARQPHRRRPEVEILEDRTLLSLMLPRQSPDPLAPGPLAVTRAVYQEVNGVVQTVASGYGSFAPAFQTSFMPDKVEVLADVYYPTNLPGGPYPLVVFLHGFHSTAYNPGTGQAADPTGTLTYSPGDLPIPNYVGYDYISPSLASDGYIVVSISANGVNEQDQNDKKGMLARAQLIQHHLDLWHQFDTSSSGPFGAQFVGKVDLNDIGLMGHSRGGEGVVTGFNYNAGSEPDPEHEGMFLDPGTRYGIKAVVPLAPTNFFRPKLNNVAYGVVLPYADGDVQSLDGVTYFDDPFNPFGSSDMETSPEHMFLVMGANHNLFNTVWTPGNTGGFPAIDDWSGQIDRRKDPFAGTVPGNKRLTPAQQQAVGAAYVTAFFRRYLGGETAFDPMLKGDALPPASTDVAPGQPADIHTTYFAPDSPATRLDVNRMEQMERLTLNSLLGAVVTSDLTQSIVPDFSTQPRRVTVLDPKKYDTQKQEPDLFGGLTKVQIKWDLATAYYQNDLPAGHRDLTRYAALGFRVGVDFSDTVRNPPTQAQDFSVVLTDGAGATASVKVSDWSTALYYPPGQVLPLPKLLLNGVRIPLGAFLTADRNLDLSDIRSIRFAFNQRPAGNLVFSNISLNDASGPARLILAPADRRKTALHVNGTSGNDTIVLRRGPAPGLVGVRINGVDQGTFQPSGPILVFGRDGNDTLMLDHSAGDFVTPAGLDWVGGTGSNTLHVDRLNNTWVSTGNRGVVNGLLRFVNTQNLIGGAARDVFILAPAEPVIVYAGAGNDVIMVTAPSSAEIHGGPGDDLIVGGHSHDVIWGDSGNDVLLGLSGDDVLIGGAGQDYLHGGLGADLLFGGELRSGLAHNDTKPYDFTTLRAISAAWAAGQIDSDLDTSLADDMDDSERDTLFGDAGRDWFFGNTTGPGFDLFAGLVHLLDRKKAL
jgi:hypothetical protein